MKSYCRGFTLSELLLAAAILAFVLAALLALFANCLILNEANRNLTVATTHAQYIMEEIRDTANADFTQVESKINNHDWDLDASEIESAPYNLAALNNESINTDVTQSGNPLGISVIVGWNDRGQKPRSIELDTLLTNYK